MQIITGHTTDIIKVVILPPNESWRSTYRAKSLLRSPYATGAGWRITKIIQGLLGTTQGHHDQQLPVASSNCGLYQLGAASPLIWQMDDDKDPHSNRLRRSHGGPRPLQRSMIGTSRKTDGAPSCFILTIMVLEDS